MTKNIWKSQSSQSQPDGHQLGSVSPLLLTALLFLSLLVLFFLIPEIKSKNTKNLGIMFLDES